MGFRSHRAIAAKAVLKLELSKLDEIQAGIYPDAVQGHLPSVYAFLSVLDRRARLLGLFSEPGVQTAVALSIGGEQQQRQPISIEFISPTRRPSPEDEPRDVTPSPYQGQAPDYGKPVLPPPREARFRWPSPKGPHDWLK